MMFKSAGVYQLMQWWW